jgi:hypothetical protein
MISNLERYKKDLEKLITYGGTLLNSIQYECYPKKFKAQVKKLIDEKSYSQMINNLPLFIEKYQDWYSESLSIIKLLLPERMNDFVKLYEKPRGRKKVEYGTYVIEDYLQGLSVTRSHYEKVVGPEAAIPQFQQQLNILKSIKRRFESSLFDIKQLVQADLFDSELDIASELNKKGFTRGAGAVAGVVLESHLSQACDNHKIKVTKKNPTINDFNQLLKDNEVIEMPTWRFIQHLADLRNLCDHKKKRDPKTEDIDELIEGVGKITKTLF